MIHNCFTILGLPKLQYFPSMRFAASLWDWWVISLELISIPNPFSLDSSWSFWQGLNVICVPEQLAFYLNPYMLHEKLYPWIIFTHYSVQRGLLKEPNFHQIKSKFEDFGNKNKQLACNLGLCGLKIYPVLLNSSQES